MRLKHTKPHVSATAFKLLNTSSLHSYSYIQNSLRPSTPCNCSWYMAPVFINSSLPLFQPAELYSTPYREQGDGPAQNQRRSSDGFCGRQMYLFRYWKGRVGQHTNFYRARDDECFAVNTNIISLQPWPTKTKKKKSMTASSHLHQPLNIHITSALCASTSHHASVHAK